VVYTQTLKHTRTIVRAVRAEAGRQDAA
jgi:hypothetical protein